MYGRALPLGYRCTRSRSEHAVSAGVGGEISERPKPGLERYIQVRPSSRFLGGWTGEPGCPDRALPVIDAGNARGGCRW